MKKPENCILVIFGATGDLTKRKLIPAIFALEIQDLLPEKFAILCTSRPNLNDEEFKKLMRESLNEYSEPANPEKVNSFINKICYQPVDAINPDDYPNLLKKLQNLRKELSINGNTIFYLSTPPSLYGVIPQNLAKINCNEQDDGWKRVVIEKPFGYDLESARELNKSLNKSWKEHQLYRIDHYLGKESVQNLLVTRFSNGIFEPLWNRNYVHHVEITSAESIGIEKRGGYYERSGALRDMIQNHLLQIVGFIAMEPPSSMDSNSIRNETVKVFQSIRPIKEDEVINQVIRGQYLAATIRGKKVRGYREEEGVDPNSDRKSVV